MFIPFQSKAAGDFFMQEAHVRSVFALMGKPFAAQGVFAAVDIATHLAQLEAGLAQGAAKPEPWQAAQAQHDAEGAEAASVGLAQRAWPLMNMLTLAQKRGVDVTWGTTI